MPIVLVHGVGVRGGPRAARTVRRRGDLLQRYLGPLVRADGPALVEQPAWGDLGTPGYLTQRLRRGELEALGGGTPDDAERCGLAEVADCCSEAASRWRSLPGRIAAQPVTALALHCLRRPLTAAAGDLLLWLDQRQRGLDGPILARVANALHAAAAAAPAGDERLLAIGHSLGGVLLYEALARRPVAMSTWLVTVGCPLTLFAALGLTGPAEPSPSRWLNVLDPADPLAFAAAATWPRAEDWTYRTGAWLWAHGGYLSRPSFHRRLAARLATAVVCR